MTARIHFVFQQVRDLCMIEHLQDIFPMYVFALLLILSLSLNGCAGAGPVLPVDGILPMGTGSALVIFQDSVAGVGGTKVLAGEVPGGTGYLFIKSYGEWFGSVLLSASGKCSDLCLQRLLNLTGNAMTNQTLQDLVGQAKSLGWQEVEPVTLPL